MSIYTSLTLSRRKALEIVLANLAYISNDDLRDLCDHILRKGAHYNVYMVVDEPQEDDERVA
jgi:hypothetical protein